MRSLAQTLLLLAHQSCKLAILGVSDIRTVRYPQSWSVYREGSDRRRCNIRLRGLTHSGIVTAEREVAKVGEMLCVGAM